MQKTLDLKMFCVTLLRLWLRLWLQRLAWGVLQGAFLQPVAKLRLAVLLAFVGTTTGLLQGCQTPQPAGSPPAPVVTGLANRAGPAVARPPHALPLLANSTASVPPAVAAPLTANPRINPRPPQPISAPVSAPVIAPFVSRSVAPPRPVTATLARNALLEFQVAIYASPTTAAYLSKTQVDASVNSQVWITFFRKYRIPFKVINAVEQLEASAASVLVLPSAVALSEREKQAVLTLQLRGVSVLASWLTGVRSENGSEIGYAFMQEALGVKVTGSTQTDVKDDYILPHGDSPVTHFLPAGTRIWLDRVKGFHPLRMQGSHPAADVMDWSRLPALGKDSGTVMFDERVQTSGRSSRSVVLGYPEQLWLSANPKQMEAIAHNAVMWLLRQPDAYLAAWPYPYRSAFVMAVDVAGTVSDIDLAYAKLLEAAGGRATYYVLGENVAKSAGKVNQLLAAGHELAYLGDTYADFSGQTEAVQARRLEAMRRMVKDAGVVVAADAGFHAPMDSYDKTTEKLLKTGKIGHLLTTTDASEDRLPFFAAAQEGARTADSGASNALVVLPRTLSGPEDSVDNCQPDVGLKPFFNELLHSEKMAGLSVVSVSGKSELTQAQSAEIFTHLNARRDHMWLATAGQVARWWRERDRVTVQLESGLASTQLAVSVSAGVDLAQMPMVLVNLPDVGSTLRLVARTSGTNSAANTNLKIPRVTSFDTWRAAVLLDGLAPGNYQWDVYFDRPALGNPGNLGNSR